jgi:hypothetical protein
MKIISLNLTFLDKAPILNFKNKNKNPIIVLPKKARFVHKWMKTFSLVFGTHVDRQKAKIKKPPIIINLET